MAYATPGDLLKRYDANVIAAQVRDDGGLENVALLPANENVLVAISEASGEVNTSIMKGGRYRVEDLEDLTGDDKEALVGSVCRIAYLKIMRRRTYAGDYAKQFKELIRERDEMLKMLRDGSYVFNIPEAIEAGKPEGIRFKRLNAQKRNYLSQQMVGKFFPHRRTFNNE